MSDIREKAEDEVFCSSCGAIIKKEAEICPKCGVRQKPAPGSAGSTDEKKPWDYFMDVLKKYAVFSGRARRAEFWWFVLGMVVISVVTGIINNWLSSVASLALLIPSIAVAWRRMHDVGKPGGFCFIPVYSLILAATQGVSGSNEYGPDPKENA
jgi:uncharacterized membrane protein YhaH (DUF805 family)